MCTSISHKLFPVVASLCYKTSASGRRVVLDGFLTYLSLIKTCGCTLTSSQRTNVSFAALNNLHPYHPTCGTYIIVQSGETSIVISCFVSGTILVSPSQPVTMNFAKPLFGYNSNYCMVLNSG